MGWGSCGKDSRGRNIGYMHAARCDHPGCNKKIDRGLAYACGGMHGDCGGSACEGYFCADHLYFAETLPGSSAESDLRQSQVCAECLGFLRENGELADE